jgi:hypothetical protein
MASERASQQAFFGVSALLFAASATVTVVCCASMSAMGEMPMPGGWTMLMAWMRMPGQTWPAAAASFLGMWVVSWGKFYSTFEGGTNFNEIGDAPFGIFYGSPVPPQFVTPFVDRGTGNVEGQRFPVPLPTTDTVINWANYLPIGTSPLSGTGTFCPTPKSTNCPSNDKSVRRPY